MVFVSSFSAREATFVTISTPNLFGKEVYNKRKEFVQIGSNFIDFGHELRERERERERESQSQFSKSETTQFITKHAYII